MPSEDFSHGKSRITERTRIGVSVAGFGTVVAGLVWIGMTIAGYQWRLQTVETTTQQLKTTVEQLPTKSDFVQVRLEFQEGLQDIREASDKERKAARRRPR